MPGKQDYNLARHVEALRPTFLLVLAKFDQGRVEPHEGKDDDGRPWERIG
jgi:hypothetical protein